MTLRMTLMQIIFAYKVSVLIFLVMLPDMGLVELIRMDFIIMVNVKIMASVISVPVVAVLNVVWTTIVHTITSMTPTVMAFVDQWTVVRMILIMTVIMILFVQILILVRQTRRMILMVILSVATKTVVPATLITMQMVIIFVYKINARIARYQMLQGMVAVKHMAEDVQISASAKRIVFVKHVHVRVAQNAI
jgi:hypothetical protein